MHLIMSSVLRVCVVALLCVDVACSNIAAFSRDRAPSEKLRPPEEWSVYGHDEGNQRFSSAATINTTNVRRLVPAYVFQTSVLGPLETNPIVSNGVMLLMNLYRATKALTVSALAASFICFALMAGAHEARSATQADVAARVSNAMRELQQYKPAPSLHDPQALSSLRSAVYTMQLATDVTALTPQNFVGQRRLLVAGWANIIRALQQSYDPSFDPNNVADLPSSCIIPPKGFPCGADPNHITDPQARAQYVNELRANLEKSKQALYYQQVHNLELGTMSIFGTMLTVFRKVAPEGATSDSAALDAILQQNGVSQARRQALDVLITATPSPP